MKLLPALASALSLSSLATAWAYSAQDSGEIGPQPFSEYIVQRQNNNNDNNPNQRILPGPISYVYATSTDKQVASSSDPPASNTQNDATATITAPPQSSGGNNNNDNKSNSGSNNDNQSSGGGSGSTVGSGNGSTQPSATSLAAIDPQAPAGGVAMISPPAISGVPYYKVDQTITWVWNYTSLARNPAAIDILASYQPTGGVAPSPFTLAVNQSFEATQTFKWDTGKYTAETSPLPIGTYTLVIYDAAAPGGVSATAAPGHLGAWEQFTFGMYTKQAGTVDVTGAIVCTTCNSAAGLRGMTMASLLASAGITVTAFTWFTGGFASLW